MIARRTSTPAAVRNAALSAFGVLVATFAAVLVATATACSPETSGPVIHSATGDPEVGGSLNGRRPFPADNPWNTDITSATVDPNSGTLITSCGVRNLHPDFGTTYDGAPNGIPYVIVFTGQPKVPVSFDYADESDPGPYPIPLDAPIEGGSSSSGDRHVIVVDVADWKLYEMFDAHTTNGGASWHAGSGAVFDLNSNALRPAGWTSADAAGLPIFPGLVRYDEAATAHAINHALRFTCPSSRAAYLSPARHFASSDTSSKLPPMGMRVRLRANFDTVPYSPTVRSILRAMMHYGMLMADNGSGWYVSGAPDSRWDDADLATLAKVPSSAFDVVKP
ncbi:MAG TPA: hypothetical protein VGM67_05895 [Gemmatimonadaceae bacterium]